MSLVLFLFPFFEEPTDVTDDREGQGDAERCDDDAEGGSSDGDGTDRIGDRRVS